ncbi:HEAT repeat domain-containing protein [Chryseobacterium sp. SORGH_AS_0447]|uniref:HEAT repeat domain-containing protein n=1 Tax=Chryseobacterium sp. SORGH_AS_0447 TaxID=3041769 RepID=UPI0027D7B6DD|nr:HEAT repeat domain-containing protein [Chryseobacterium sp. SORGH_AS_0447]
MKQYISKSKSKDPEIIEKALDDLGDLNPDNALELILPFLNHHSKEVRETAVCNLGEINNEKAISYIIEKAKNDEESVRKHAFKALEEYNSPQIFKTLINEVYQEKKSRGPRQIIAEQLRNYPSRESQKALIYLILNDDDYFVFIPAIDSLYSMNDKTLLDTWKKIDALYNHDYVNSVAKRAIEDIEKVKNDD